MLKRSSWGIAAFGAAAVICLVSSLGFPASGVPSASSPPSPAPLPPSSPKSAPAPAAKTTPAPVSKQPQNPAPVPIPEQSYIGSSACFECHRPQAQVWGTTKHSHEFSGLPAKYRNDSSCLACHVTGYGSPSGFVAGSPANPSKDLASVGCEMCHGPGALHKNAAQRLITAEPADQDKVEKEMRDTVRKIPSDKVCAACHKNEAHQRHPAYDGQPPQSVVRHAASADSVCPCGDYPPAGTDIKACASCHYGKYQTWMTGTHADLSANMPAKYAADKQCLKCHAIPSGPSGSVAAAAAANVHNRLGVACESCHGPAREHVDFNRQFMASPPLGPEMEQMARQIIHKGKPANACIDCHSVQSHKEHPKYDKT